MPSTAGLPMQYGIIKNERKQCSLKGCQNNRRSLYKWCHLHYRRAYFYGHPDGRKIKRGEYKQEKEKVSQIIERNLSHVAIQEGIKFFDTWITRAVVGSKAGGIPSKASEYIARLADKKVTGKDCLIEVAAFWTFAWRNQHLFPSDRAMVTGLGIAILYLHRPQGGETVPGAPRRDAGEYVQRHLGLLLMRLLKQVEKDEDREEERQRAIREPLD